MSELIYLVTLAVIAGTFILVFAMRFLSSFRDARSRTAREEAYRNLAETATAAQNQCAVRLASLQTEVAHVGTRLSAIEKILNEVG